MCVCVCVCMYTCMCVYRCIYIYMYIYICIYTYIYRQRVGALPPPQHPNTHYARAVGVTRVVHHKRHRPQQHLEGGVGVYTILEYQHQYCTLNGETGGLGGNHILPNTDCKIERGQYRRCLVPSIVLSAQSLIQQTNIGIARMMSAVSGTTGFALASQNYI